MSTEHMSPDNWGSGGESGVTRADLPQRLELTGSRADWKQMVPPSPKI
jgi:hypothetical protein